MLYRFTCSNGTTDMIVGTLYDAIEIFCEKHNLYILDIKTIECLT